MALEERVKAKDLWAGEKDEGGKGALENNDINGEKSEGKINTTPATVINHTKWSFY